MKKLQQEIECASCGETQMEFLTEEDSMTLNDVAGSIDRDCTGCGKTSGWIRGLRQSAAVNNTIPLSWQNQFENVRTAEIRTIKGQERIATQAERDKVNSLVQSEEHKN